MRKGNRNQKNKNQSNKDQLLKSGIAINQTQILTRENKSTINSSQDNMNLLMHSNPTTAGPKYSNITEAKKKKNLKIAFSDMVDVLNKEMKRFFKEI